MQRSQAPGLQVLQASTGVDERTLVAGHGHRHGVDGEVPPHQVFLDGASRARHRQRPRSGVALDTGGGDVDVEPAGHQPHGPEALEGHDSPAEVRRRLLGQGAGVAHDGHVGLPDGAPPQQPVAHRPADQVGRRAVPARRVGHGLQQGPHLWSQGLRPCPLGQRAAHHAPAVRGPVGASRASTSSVAVISSHRSRRTHSRARPSLTPTTAGLGRPL